MSQETGVQRSAIRKLLLTPWGIAGLLMAIFFIGQAYLALRDRSVQTALENDPAFAAPALDLTFSKHIAYDPLTFVGKGAQAGFWQWSPDGLVLTDKGRQFFDESGDTFTSRVPAGKRRLKRIRTNTATASGDRQIGFLFEWSEVSPPAAALLSPPPHTNDEYPGEAVMTREGGAWKMKSLRTRDFEEPLERLRMAAAGVLK
jgi:hypothetical protein